MRIRRPLHLGILIVVVSCGRVAQAQTKSNDLFLPAKQTGKVLSLIQEPFVIRSRVVRINSAILTGLTKRKRRAFKLNLFANAKFAGRVTSFEKPYADSVGLSGVLSHVTGTFTLLRHKNVLVGHIVIPSKGSFQIRPAGQFLYSISEIDESKLKECGVGVGPDRGHKISVIRNVLPSSTGSETLRDDGSEITVLAVYTPAARDLAASEAGHSPGTSVDIESLVDTCIAETNEAYRLSKITPRLRLVYRGQELYNGDMGGGARVYDVLPLFRNKNDGVMDDVHAARDSVKADVSVLLMVASDAGGLASMMNQDTFNVAFESQAFAVVDMDSASGNYAFGHEIGHIQGNCHDRSNCLDDNGQLDQGVFRYSYGFRYVAGGVLYHTIMAYRPGSLTLHFSNPDVNDSGTATGVSENQPQPCDEAKTISNTAPVVANFRN
jgi:peptidyl-Asp metalloendopeptidase